MEPIIRPATANDVIELNGKAYNESFRGIVAELDGQVIGIAGVLHGQELQAFSSIKDEIRNYPVLILRTAKEFRQLLKIYQTPIYAKASPDEKNSEKFLKFIGFKQFYEDIFIWEQ